MLSTYRWTKRFVSGCVSVASVGALLFSLGCASMGLLSGRDKTPSNYAATIRDALQNYASDMQGYHFRATPVGNFGVGSIYMDDLSDPNLSRVESSWYLGGPGDWLSPSTPATDRQRLIAEGSMGAFSSSSTNLRAINAEAGIAILSVLTGTGTLDYHKGVVTTFRATEVINRRLNWAEFQTALGAGRISPAVAKVVNSDKFVVVAADIVLVGYQAEVAVDEKLNPSLAASLRSSILLPGSRKAQASFSLSEGKRGHFVAQAQQPVVAAVLFKRPPLRPKDGPMPSIDEWPTAAIKGQSIDAVETRVLERTP